jgi:hypothetical protein
MKILTGGIATASFIALALGACGNDGGSASFGQIVAGICGQPGYAFGPVLSCSP